MRLLTVISIVFSAALVYSHNNVEEVKSFNGYQTIRVFTQTDKEFDALITLYNSEHNFDFWNGPTRIGSTDIMASPEKLPILVDFLRTHALKYSVLVQNVETLVAQERRQMELLSKYSKAGEIDWTNYYSSDDIITWLNATAESNSDIASTQVIGKSFEGRDLVLLKISTGGTGKPAFFIDGTAHAREWISPAVTTYIINELLNNRGNYQDILDSVDFYIIPILNIDGYEFSRSSNRMWRKTRSENNSICKGVDPNRNYDYHFGELGASSDKCSETYHGPSAFSEPETDALRKFIEANRDVNWTVYISMHSYSQLLLSPWNWTRDLPEDDAEIMNMANAAVAAIESVHGKRYVAGSGANVLYYSSGCSVDWFKDIGNFKYSYTIELRDEGSAGFLLPPNQIIPNSEEIWAGVQTMARYLNKKF